MGKRRLVATYTEVLASYLLATTDIKREMALFDATEVGKALQVDDPVIDQLFEVHRLAQLDLAKRWAGTDTPASQREARERLLFGEAIPLMLALMMPHEIQQRARQERRWSRENAKLEAMFEQTDALMVIFDADGLIDEVNPAFVAATGFGAPAATLGEMQVWKTPLPARGTEHYRGEQLKSDGTAFMAEWSVSPIFGTGGALIGHVCIGRDVTRQQKIDDTLRETDKLRAVATLAAGIAHDFNNLLGSVIGLAELCELEAPPGSRLERNLGRIRNAGDKATALVRQLLDFSRQTPKLTERTRLSEFLANTEVLLRAALPINVALGILIDQDEWVYIDVVEMEQVLLNMARNAAYALHGREGRIDIRCDLSDPAESGIFTPESQPIRPTHARLRVEDDGDGIPQDLITKIFEPFFTTKPVGEGTGLGLSAAHGIVKSHGGVIEVASTPGRGSIFSIFLPLAGNAPQVPAQPAESTDIEMNTGNAG